MYSNVDLIWRVTPYSIPESPAEDFSSLGIQNISWDKF
jgi:hypothetical protein